MRQLAISLLLSVAASVLGTCLLRQALSASSALADAGERPAGENAVVVVVPIFVGNSGNRLLSPTHVHRSLFGGGKHS